MNALLERWNRQRAIQRRRDGELLMEEFLGPATCTVCGLPRIVVDVAKVPQLIDDKICRECKDEVAAHAARYSMPIIRALREVRDRHDIYDVRRAGSRGRALAEVSHA